MKTLHIAAALVAFHFASAQKTVELKEFKNIAISGDVEITLKQGNEFKLVTDDDEELDIQNPSGYLSIQGDGSATVYFKGELENVAAGSDCILVCNDEIKAKVFNLAAASDSEVSLKIYVKEFHVAASSDAEVSISGKADMLDAAVASDAEFNAKKLEVKDVTINVSSDGEAIITAKGTVNAVVSSDGELTIYGKPKKVNETKSDDGEINIVN